MTLKLERGIHPPTPFLFTINESTSVSGAGIGVSSLTGNLLDGNYSGIAGTPFSAILRGKTGGFNAPVGTTSASSVVVPSGRSPEEETRVLSSFAILTRQSCTRRHELCTPTVARARIPEGLEVNQAEGLGYSGINAKALPSGMTSV